MSGTLASVAARDGVLLCTRRWVPGGDAWARLLLIHGIAEHSGRYERTGTLFAAGGVEVSAFDLRGFGGSGGRRAFVRRWDEYLDDVEDRLAALREGLPLVLMGHSMGGLIALTYVTSGRPAPDLLVLSSPALGTSVPGPVRALAALTSRVLPTVAIPNALRGEQLSSDPVVGRAYFADPLVVPRSTTRLGAELFAAAQRGRRDLARLRVPTLVIHGSADTIVPPASTEPLGTLPNVQRRVYRRPASRDPQRASGTAGRGRHPRLASRADGSPGIAAPRA
ncbi:MAG TPA: alpha/beta fold hydrolase [Candidatus Acidoferrales bacterium]|nr:alpha/beta fold hydrolase [Candidatus Acidoferrales bacterium]